jgi:hypothetical protein
MTFSNPLRLELPLRYNMQTEHRRVPGHLLGGSCRGEGLRVGKANRNTRPQSEPVLLFCDTLVVFVRIASAKRSMTRE